MKKFIYVTVAFMLMLVFIGCATTTPDQRKETYDMRKEVGNIAIRWVQQQFDARGMMPHLAY